MAQFRTSADLKSSVLRRCGENQDGTSSFDTQAIDYLNQIHSTVITGGNEFETDIDEPWVWARATRPIVLELQPVFNTGSVAIVLGAVTGTFSSAPTVSVEGWFLKLSSSPETYKIVSHSANTTGFSIDAAFTQSTVTADTFQAFKLDYELVNSYITVNSSNDTADFIANGSNVATATLVHGSYTPAGYATQFATALQTADPTRAYTGSYDTNQRFFSFTSNLAASAVFKPQGAGSNYYRSAWNTAGFDYANATNAATQTSLYPLTTCVRLTGPARLYFNDTISIGGNYGTVEGIDPLTLDRDFPLSRSRVGVPSLFSVIAERNGTLTVRFNKYPDKKMRCEFEHIPIPKDLKDSAASIPLLPRKFIRLLEYGAAFYILTDKRDSKADKYFQIAQQTLKSMQVFNRKELQRISRNFGSVVARQDLLPDARARRLNIYGYDAGSY